MDVKLDDARKQAQAELAAAGELDGLSEDEVRTKVEATDTFKAADKEYGIGSTFWTTGTAATGLLAGVLGGNVQSGAAAATAPLLAKLVKEATAGKGEAGEVARIALHTLASAVLAKAQGGDAGAGAAGGFIAAAGAKVFAQAIYGKDAEQLAPDEKMVILNLVAALSAAGGGAVTGDTRGMVSAGNAARVEVENNSMHGCSPVTCKQDLDIIGGGGSSLGGGMIGGGAGIGLATIISEMFGDDSDDVESKPNAGQDLTDAEKAELGGAGSGTGTPPPPENEPNQKNNKPTQKLNQKQESSIRKIDNAIKNALKDHDIAGTPKDMDGNPVPKRNGGSWDHMQEMKNTLSGLRNNANTLKNVNNPEAQAAYARATDAINKIESALKGHGI